MPEPTTATTVPPREPLAGHANYPGDHTGIIGQVKGPNALREHVTAVTATYDPATNRTRVGFAYTTQADVDGYSADGAAA